MPIVEKEKNMMKSNEIGIKDDVDHSPEPLDWFTCSCASFNCLANCFELSFRVF